jgi:sugar O-acyltransferase (sialic acid O-acetyltransferase NeuD family)
MRTVVIFGAGGHGQVVADILLRRQETGAPDKPIGFLDDNPALAGRIVLGLPVLGPLERLDEVDHGGVVVGIGDNRIRARIFASLRARGECLVTAVHTTAVIAPDARLGDGVVVMAGVVVNTGSVIGDDAILNTGCTVDHHGRIGDHAHVAPGAHLGGEVRVGPGALVGVGSAVAPGRTIGEWAIVGAGAAVVRDVPPHTTAVGVPARVIRHHSEGG